MTACDYPGKVNAADHIDHVRTQMPYALALAGIGLSLGDIPSGLGLNPGWSILLGTIAIAGVVMLVGRRVRGD